jgi:integrase
MGMIWMRGKIPWIKYYRDGKSYYESANKALGIKNATKADAKKLLQRREGAIADGRFQGLSAEKTAFGGFKEVHEDNGQFDYKRDGKKYAVYGMFKELVDDYRLNKRASIPQVLRSLWELSKKLEGHRLSRITTDQIKDYKTERVKAGMANATINRELAALKRIFRLALSSTPPKVTLIPKIEMLEEKNIRRGFFEHAEYLAVRNELQDYLKPVVECGYVYGGRKEEILSIEWPMVDMINGKINLGESKNGDPRIWYLTPELYKTLLEYKMRRDSGYPDPISGKPISHKKVFVRPDGKPIINFREGWEAACRRAGLEGRLFHDLRRTAVRNMELAGVKRKVAMLISGHRTESIYNRYRIVNEADLSAATTSLDKYFKSLGVKIDEYAKKVTNTVTIKETEKS